MELELERAIEGLWSPVATDDVKLMCERSRELYMICLRLAVSPNGVWSNDWEREARASFDAAITRLRELGQGETVYAINIQERLADLERRWESAPVVTPQ